MVQGQGRLDQAGRSGGRLGVADLRFDRTEGAPRPLRFTVNLPQGRNLHGITDLGAGAVGLHQSDAFRGDAGALVGVQDRFFLSGAAGGVDRLTLAVTG